MNRRLCLSFLLLALAACGMQQPPALPHAPGALEDRLYAPAVVLANADRLRLDLATREAIRADVRATQARWDATDAQLRVATGALAETLDATHVDEADAAARGAEVMRLEDALKADHLALLVRLKNRLTPAQRASLDATRHR